MPAAWSSHIKVIWLSAVHTNLPTFRFGTFESVQINIQSVNLLNLLKRWCVTGLVELRVNQEEVSLNQKFQITWCSGRIPSPCGVFGIWWSPQCAVLHIQSTMADSRAMTATPENMSRICSNDCLESMAKRRFMDNSITEDSSQQQRTAGSLLDWPLVPTWQQN